MAELNWAKLSCSSCLGLMMMFLLSLRAILLVLIFMSMPWMLKLFPVYESVLVLCMVNVSLLEMLLPFFCKRGELLTVPIGGEAML